VARAYLDPRRAVTAVIKPEERTPAAARVAAERAARRPPRDAARAEASRSPGQLPE
jgi:hypothetical protein